MIGWLFGRIVESFNADKWFFEKDRETGRDQKFWKIDDECPICCAPGFSCESIKNCKYFPTSK